MSNQYDIQAASGRTVMRCVVQFLSFLFLLTPCASEAQDQVADEARPPVVLSVRQALNEVLSEAVAVHTQRLDLQVQAAQAQLASREFLPQGTLKSQLERGDADANSVLIRHNSASAGIESSLKLRTGTTLTASIGRSTIESPGQAESDTRTGKTTTSSIGLIQPLLRGAGRAAATLNERQAALGLSSAQQSFELAMSELVLSCVSAYFGLEQAKQNVLLARATADRAAEVSQVNEALFAAGRIARTTRLQNEVDQAQAEFGLAQAQQAEKVAARQLLRLIGRNDPDDTPLELSDSFSAYLAARDANESATVREALARRVDLGLARNNLAASQLALAAARDNQRNQLDLYAKVDHQTSPGGSPGAMATNRAIGLILSIPLEKSDLRIAVANAQAAVAKAQLLLNEFERNVRAETRDAIKAIDFSQQQYRLALRTAELAERRLADEVEKARAGRSSATDLSFAQDALRQARSQEVQAQYAVFTAQLELQRATGTALEQWQTTLTVRGMVPLQQSGS